MALALKKIFAKYSEAKREYLIPVLQDAQDELGYLSREVIAEISEHLDIPASKIYGVATFYNQFRFQAQGKYHIQICRGTACHVKGSVKILETLKTLLQIKEGQTTRDGIFSLEIVACIGACGLAPVINVNGNFHANLTPEKLEGIIESYKQRG